jgi:hypothetical protein
MSEVQPYRPQLRRRKKPTTVFIASLIAFAIAALMLWWVVRVASKNPEIANLGPEIFRFDAERLADEIDDRGPFLLKDPLNRGRELYVQHTGSSPKRGWQAISAYAAEPDLDCLLHWRESDEEFIDPCTDQTYPADGEGLATYPVEVVDGRVEVDLKKAASRTDP